MYDYERQTSEEVSFQEGSKVAIYDQDDPEWFLVEADGAFGFAPSNYLDISSHSPAVIAHQAPTLTAARPESIISLPPIAPPLPTSTTSAMKARSQPDYTDHTALDSAEESAPPTPQRPSLPTPSVARGPPMAPRPSQSQMTTAASTPDPPEAASDTRYRTWSVQEVDGKKKKRKGTLGIGNMEISWAADKSNEAIQTWSITSLLNYSTEKKHVFIDLQAPPRTASFDFHAGSSENAADINAVLGEMAGAARAPGIREIAGALKAPLPKLPEDSGLARKERETGYAKEEQDEDDVQYAGAELLHANEKYATVLYDFEAQGDDEVTVRAGARVVVIDDRASPDWWKIRAGRKEGVIPSDYLEISAPRKQHKKKSSRSDEPRQAKAAELKAQATGGKSKPDPKKVRSWTDKSRSFKVDAQLLGCSDGKIHLHKANGVKISVPVTKMCSEDIEYVEHKTGQVLRGDRQLADTSTIVAKTRDDKEAKRREAVSASKAQPVNDFDWFDFFLTAGCDPNVCQRYTSAFERDGLIEDDVSSLDASVLRNLGVREGDILKIGRALDVRLGRQREVPSSFGDVLQRDGGDMNGTGLLSGPTGELRNNTRRGRPDRGTNNNDVVDAAAFQSARSRDNSAVEVPQAKPSHAFEDLSLLDQPLIPTRAPVAASVIQTPVQQSVTAPRPQSVPPQASYPTEQFLQSIQALQPQRTAAPPAVAPFMPQTSFGSAIIAHKTGGGDIKDFIQPPLYPHQTGYQQQQEQLMMQNVAPAPYQDPFKTGSAAPYQDPFRTGAAGFQAQATGFFPQPTGFVPSQNGFQQPQQFAPVPQQSFMPTQMTGYLPAQAQYGYNQPQVMGLAPAQPGMYLQQNNLNSQQTGFNPAQPFNSSLPAFGGQMALQQTGMSAFGAPMQQFNGYAPPMQQQQPQMSAGMLKMQEMMAQAQAQQPPAFGHAQQNGFQPVSFGRSASAGPTGRKANLSAASAANPFGF